MMTSSLMCFELIEGKRIAVKLPEDNQLLINIKNNLKNRNKLVYIMANPYRYNLNDSLFNLTKKSFKLSGIDFKKYKLIDYRYKGNLKEELKDTDLIILGGGDCEPQLAFFENLNLKGLLKDYNGLIIGRSAGSMDMASTVYCCPEFDYQLGDRKYAKGLGLTKIMTLSHYNSYKDYKLGGQKLIEDIVFNDIKDKKLYVLEDGSYILIKKGKSIIYGRAYLITNKTITKICENDKTSEIK